MLNVIMIITVINTWYQLNKRNCLQLQMNCINFIRSKVTVKYFRCIQYDLDVLAVLLCTVVVLGFKATLYVFYHPLI